MSQSNIPTPSRDLKDLNEVKVRSANTGPEKHMMCYLKTDIEKRYVSYLHLLNPHPQPRICHLWY